MTGTPISLEALLQESDWLRRVARALVRDEAAADDLAQDVLDAASSRPPALEGRRLRGWLSTVARRRAARVRTRAEARLRAEHARSRDEAVDPGPERDDALDRVVLHRELARVIADLGAAERTAIVEHYLEGRSFAEIAARSGVSEAAVRQRTSRAVRRLRARLSEDDPRWAHWLPALALAVPVGPSPATPESVVAAAAKHGSAPLLPIAGALLTVKFAVSAGALAIVVLVLVALSSTPGSNARTSRPTFADGVIGRAEPSREFASSSAAVPVPALSRSAVTTADLDLVDEARIAIVDPSGAPIEGLRAACILGNRTVEALAFDGDGTAQRPNNRCVIVATAPGFVGREFALDAPEPGELRATRTLDRIEPMEVELEFGESVSAAGVADVHDSFRASAGWEAFPVAVADEVIFDRVDPHVDLKTRVTVERGPSGLRLSVLVEARSLQFTFPDHLEVTSVDRAAVSESYLPNVVRIDSPRKRVVIGLRELPSIPVRALWEDDATPFHGSVSIARMGDYWVPSIGTRTDARGEFRVATVVATGVGSDRNTLARWFRFRFFDVESGYSFETKIPRSELESLGSPATFLVPRPRIVHLHVVSESDGSFVPAVAEVLVGERVVETDGRGRCVVSWPPGGEILVSAFGHALCVLPEPSDRIDHGPDSPLRVVLQPVPTLEVLLPRTEDVHLRIDTTSGVGLIAKDAHSDLEPEAWSLWHRRSSLVGRIGKLGTIDHTGVAGQIDYHPDDEGRIVESCLRTDIPLRLRVADRLGTTLAETEVQLDEARTVDLREAIEETRDIVVHVVDPNGTPVPIGKVKLVGMVNGSKLSSRTGYHGGRAHLRSIAPGDYTVTAWALGQDASDGATGAVSVTEGDAEITLTVVP